VAFSNWLNLLVTKFTYKFFHELERSTDEGKTFTDMSLITKFEVEKPSEQDCHSDRSEEPGTNEEIQNQKLGRFISRRNAPKHFDPDRRVKSLGTIENGNKKKHLKKRYTNIEPRHFSMFLVSACNQGTSPFR
jgi:hypothetical protein